MKKHLKSQVNTLILTNNKQEAVNLLRKRHAYLKSKLGPNQDDSNQMKYLAFHLKKLGTQP